jgi:hypothetical protein
MKIRPWPALAIVLILLIYGGASLRGAALAADQRKPNIILMLADNLGYGDLGSYGGGETRGMPTPRLDELAYLGMRLT